MLYRSLFLFYLQDLNNFEHTVFVHVLDQCPQDGKLVVSIITDVLERLKSHDDSIKQACIRSDNASCYHSTSTVLSMPAISRETGIDIRRMDFADPQGGKGEFIICVLLDCSLISCDRIE